MKLVYALALTLSLSAGTAFAATKTYQVTGPILEVKDDVIVVQKGKEKWEIARTPDTKVTGDLKVGGKVTIEYRMTAATIEAKEGKAPKAAKDGAPAAASPSAPVKAKTAAPAAN